MSIHCDNPHLLNETKINGYNVVVMISGMVALLFFSVLIGFVFLVEIGSFFFSGLGYILLGNLIIDFLIFRKFSWIFRVLTWDHQGITSKNIITRSQFHIPWDEARIVSTDKKGYVIHGKKKTIDIDAPPSAGNEADAAHFVQRKWREVYPWNDTEMVLYCTDDYKASITKDHLRINGKTLPLSRIQFVWKEHMDDYGEIDHQIFILKIKDFDDLAVKVELAFVDTFYQRLYEWNNTIRFFDYPTYSSMKSRKNPQLSGAAKEFCGKRHKYRVGFNGGTLFFLLGCSPILYDSEWLAILLGVQNGWLFTCIYLLVVGLIATIFTKTSDKLINAYRRRGHVESL